MNAERGTMNDERGKKREAKAVSPTERPAMSAKASATAEPITKATARAARWCAPDVVIPYTYAAAACRAANGHLASRSNQGGRDRKTMEKRFGSAGYLKNHKRDVMAVCLQKVISWCVQRELARKDVAGLKPNTGEGWREILRAGLREIGEEIPPVLAEELMDVAVARVTAGHPHQPELPVDGEGEDAPPQDDGIEMQDDEDPCVPTDSWLERCDQCGEETAHILVDAKGASLCPKCFGAGEAEAGRKMSATEAAELSCEARERKQQREMKRLGINGKSVNAATEHKQTIAVLGEIRKAAKGIDLGKVEQKLDTLIHLQERTIQAVASLEMALGRHAAATREVLRTADVVTDVRRDRDGGLVIHVAGNCHVTANERPEVIGVE